MAGKEKPKRGRPKKIPSTVETKALAYAVAGAPGHTAAVAALTEEEADPARIWAVQLSLGAAEGGNVIWIDESGEFRNAPNLVYVKPTEEDVENARRSLERDRTSASVEMHPDNPAADTDDDGNDYLWIPSAFLEHGKCKLVEAGVKVTPYDDPRKYGDTGERKGVNTLTRYVIRHARAQAEASLRAAEAYCKAIEEYAERHGFKRTPNYWGGWHFDEPQDRLDAMQAYARMAAHQATRSGDWE